MILDARELPHDVRLDADVAVVGAGPAGITLAHRLMKSGLTVLLLEAGGLKPAATPPEGFHGEVEGLEPHPPLTLYRTRGLGGTSTLWGGRCVPFDPIDFEPRAHVPWSGWPLGHGEMLPWYEVALDYCEAGPFRFRPTKALGPMVAGLTGTAEGLERFSRPTDFGRRYRPDLARSQAVVVVVSAACVGIDREPSGKAVAGLRFASAPGHRFTVRARAYVLAAGALETTRLLLASGLDGGGLVGRFYMCHLEGKAAVARFRPGLPVVFHYERDADGVYFRRHFAVRPDLQRTHAMTNVILRFEPPAIADPAHGSPVLSAMWLSRTFLKPEYARKLASFGYRGDGPRAGRALLRRHLANVGAGMPQLARFSVDWLARHVLAGRKLPYVAAVGRDGAFTLDYNAEQVPNPDSRVTLGGEVDFLGLPRLKVDWRVSALDVESIVVAHRLLARRIAHSGTGILEVDDQAIRTGYNAIGGHHIGTARMADTPAQGVVDRDCRMFGLENLYVAGSAVFPTSSHANPTLTIVALAARLARHLERITGCRGSAADERLPEAAE